MARGQPRGNRRAEEKTLRRLLRAGCDRDALRLLVSQLDQELTEEGGSAGRLSELADFATSLGGPAARDYFHAIGATQAVAELTDERVLSFARSVDPHTAEWYFWAISGTRAVRELTSDRVLEAVEFFHSLDSPATVEYFLALRETKAAAALTDEQVLRFAQEIGSDAAVQYFGALWETRAVPELTDPRVLDFALGLGPDAAQEYFRTVRETKAVAELTDGRLLASVRSWGSRVAEDYFLAIRQTKSAAELTDEKVLIFAEVIGKGPARQYFRTIGSTKAVAELTSDGVLRASGAIRSIGSDAALDYFLAAAAHKAALAPPPGGEGAPAEGPAAAVPVLTLLDIPTYDRYRPLGLLGMSVVFWLAAWQVGSLSAGGSDGVLAVSVTLVVWLGVLYGAFLLLGALADRSAEQFLQRRRRLLNEHGIRWHDCRATDQRCDLCWSAAHAHEDRRYDYVRFCRCPAC